MQARVSTMSASSLSTYAELFDHQPPRVQRRMIQILEAAIRNYFTLGIEKTTYESIAKAGKISRPLIQHYFKDKDEIFVMALKYIRVTFQKLAIDGIARAQSHEGQMKEYVGSLFEWLQKYPMHAKVWNLMYYYAAVDSSFLAMHTHLAEMGHQRIIALLREGAKEGVFSGGDLERRAKLIQTMYTGGLIMVTAEKLYVSLDTFRQYLTDAILEIAIKGPVSGKH